MGEKTEFGTECPENDLRAGSLIPVKMLRNASLALALAGLFLLYQSASQRDLPPVRAGEITPAMNFAAVRVSGEVVRDLSVLSSGGWMFTLRDGSGEISVFCSRAQAEALKAGGKAPRRGDRVEVGGSLNVSAGKGIRLRMQSESRFTLTRALRTAPSGTEPLFRLNEVASVEKGCRIAVRGVLKKIRIPGPGSNTPYVLILEDAGAELPVVFWDDAFSGPERKLPVPGRMLEVCGTVDRYKNEVRIKLNDLAGLRTISEKERNDSGERARL